MSKRSLSSLLLCLSLGAFGCTDHPSGHFGDEVNAPGDSSGGGSGNAGSPSGGGVGGQGGPIGIPQVRTDADVVTPVPGDPSPPPEPVPEPITMLLFGSGLAGIAYRDRRKRMARARRAGDALGA